ncbi:MAG: SDR family NAD(P)-dependent oxidoreductase [Pseudomonas marincola]|uniref:SDR family NAD(P)-dependent oxidoreductase n=1 Tax=Pseudomonas marincola TaxID=437900 RepID=UPI0030038440
MTLSSRLQEAANIVICGASRGIGLAMTEQLLASPHTGCIWAIARSACESPELDALQKRYPGRLERCNVDVTDEASIERFASQLQGQISRLHVLISTAAVLHQDGARAEKGLAQLDQQSLHAAFQTNAFGPVLLLKHLLPLLRGRHACTVAALSARVGSIGDNHLGGWYSYRASKAALNQLMHTASIELRRLNPQSCVLLLHPGTTDTELSKPFQANVPSGKLFSCSFAASQLLAQIDRHDPEQTGSFWAWDGQPIEW